jgi:membrane protein implicated in regulation of membrane protease activity
MVFSSSVLWLLIGVVAILVEILAIIPGIGFFFMGLGALSVSILLATEQAAALSPIAQIAWFFGFTILFGLLLWKPLKRWRLPSAKSDSYSNMIGDTVVVEELRLSQGIVGKVKWSGTVMNAELAPERATAEVGEKLEIIAVKGNTLVVK